MQQEHQEHLSIQRTSVTRVTGQNATADINSVSVSLRQMSLPMPSLV